MAYPTSSDEQKTSDIKVSSPVRPQLIIGHLRQQTLEYLKSLMGQFFSASDDLFYEMSKRATSNAEENLYFDSMREVRIRRKALQKQYLDSISARFDQLSTPGKTLSPKTKPDTLALFDSEELEIEVARMSMASRARSDYSEALYEIDTRLNHLLPNIVLNENNNPIEPLSLTSSFTQSATNDLSLSVKAQLTLFKLFEKNILGNLQPLYTDLNKILINSGILPKVSKHIHKATGNTDTPSLSNTRAENNAVTSAESNPTGNATKTLKEILSHTEQGKLSIASQLNVDTLATLMAGARIATQNSHPEAYAGNTTIKIQYNFHFYSQNPGPILNSTDLTQLLARSQVVVDRKLADKKAKNVVRSVVSQLLGRQNPEMPSAVEQSDEDIINFVAMFFDKLIEDDNLSPFVQSLVCRLQIPILKIALQDNTFLSQKDHPARVLINLITSSSIAFEHDKTLERDPLYRLIVDSVQSINRNYAIDNKIIETELERLSALIHREKERTHIVETRTQEAEFGRSKVRVARSLAHKFLLEKMRLVRIPDTISHFLTTDWLQVLVMQALKYGEQSPEWRSCQQFVTSTLWLCNAPRDKKSIARVKRLKPELFDILETQLDLVINNSESLHKKVRSVKSVINRIDSEDRDGILLRPLNKAQIRLLSMMDADLEAQSRHTLGEASNDAKIEISSATFKEAKEMQESTWVEYKDKLGKSFRCKLSAKINGDVYLFVNRFGVKVMEKTRRQFASDLQLGKVRILDSQPIFEKAMIKVVNQLTQAA